MWYWLPTLLALSVCTAYDDPRYFGYTGSFENSAFQSPFRPVEEIKLEDETASRRSSTGKRSDLVWDGCKVTQGRHEDKILYKAKEPRHCPLRSFRTVLFPTVDLDVLTNNFISTSKLMTKQVLKSADGRAFTAELFSPEAYHSAEGHLTLTSFKATIEFNLENTTPESIKIKAEGNSNKFNGKVVIEKEEDHPEYSYKVDNINGLLIENFLSVFGLQSQYTNSHWYEKLFSARISLQDAKIRGIVVPRQAFEFIGMGKRNGQNEDSLLVVQNYAGEMETLFEPKFGVFLIKDQEQDSTLGSLFANANLLPWRNLTIKPQGPFAISAASRDIVALSNTGASDMMTDFVSKNSLYAMRGGGYIVYSYPIREAASNSGRVIQVNADTESAIMMIRMNEQGYSVISPDTMSGWLVDFGVGFHQSFQMEAFSAADKNLLSRKGDLDSVEISENLLDVRININLTDPEVMVPGVLSLTGATMTMLCRQQGDTYDWILSGAGQRTILGKKTNLEIYATGSNSRRQYKIKGNLDFHSVEQINNQTNVTYLPPEFDGSGFQRLRNFTIYQVRFDIDFPRRGHHTIMRIFGKAEIYGKEDIEMELLIFNHGSKMFSALALRFYESRTDEVINSMANETLVKETLLPFQWIDVIVHHNPDIGSDSNTSGNAVLEQIRFKTSRLFPETQQVISLNMEHILVDRCTTVDTNPLCFFTKIDESGLFNVQLKGEMSPSSTIIQGEHQLHTSCNGRAVRVNFINMQIKYSTETEESNTYINYCLSGLTVPSPKIFLDQEGSNLRMRLGDEGSEIDAWSDLYTVAFKNIKGLSLVNPRLFFPVDPTRRIHYIVFESDITLGTSDSNKLKFSGTTRQFLYLYNYRRNYVYALKSGLNLKQFFQAYDLPATDVLLDRPLQENTLVVGKSPERTVVIPELNTTVTREGATIVIHGKYMEESRYYQIRMYLESDMFFTRIYLPVLTLFNGSLTLTAANKEISTGPVLEYISYNKYLSAALHGYVETIGLSGEVVMQMAKVSTGEVDNRTFTLQLRGRMFDEVSVTAQFRLTTSWQEADLSKMDGTMSFELTQEQLRQQNAMGYLNEMWNRIVNRVRVLQNRAGQNARKALRKANRWDTERSQRRSEILTSEIEIQQRGQDIEDMKREITTDCVDHCRYIRLPGVALANSGIISGKQIKTLKWVDRRDTFFDPACIAKCEANKISTMKRSVEKLREARTLLETYRRQIDELGDIQQVQAAVQELRDIATELQALEADLSTKGSSGHNIDGFSISFDESLKIIQAPCLRLKCNWHHTGQEYEETFLTCFNGRFFYNIAKDILAKQYSWVNDLGTINDKIKLKRADIDRLHRKLRQIRQDIRQKARQPRPIRARKNIGVAEKRLLRIVETRIPAPVVRGDKTTRTMISASPWAAGVTLPQFGFGSTDGSFTPLELPAEPCARTRSVLEGMHSLAQEYHTTARSYIDGKTLTVSTAEKIKRNLEETENEINSEAQMYKLTSSQKDDMQYWMNVTKQGYAKYFDDRNAQLMAYNAGGNDALTESVNALFYQNGYGNAYTYLNKLSLVASDLQRRSSVRGYPHVQQFNMMKRASQGLKRMVSSRGLTLEQSAADVSRLYQRLEQLKSNLPKCA